MTNDDLIRRGDAIRIVKGAWARSKTPEDFYAITVTAFENILPYEQPEQRWIPVSERPPEIGHNVLISTIYGSVGEGEYKGFDGYHHKWIQYRWTATLWDDEVIAWMPLPEPYKAENEDKG